MQRLFFAAFLIGAGIFSCLFSAEIIEPCPPPFDADLFRRNIQVCSARADFLFWRVQEGALDFALKMQNAAWGPSQCYAQGRYKSATFDGDPGFRIAVSFFRAPKFWEIWAQYTRFSARGSNRTNAPENSSQFLTGTWPQVFTNSVNQARSYIHMNYNITDLLVDRVFIPNPHLRLRLMGGGVVAWIDQFWKIRYADSAGYETKITNRWKFTGGGLKIGTLLDWYWFFKTLYITGGASFATFLGSYHNGALQTTNFQPDPSFNPTIPVRDSHFQDIRPVLTGQFFLGPSLQQTIANHRIEFLIGYEATVWFNLQEVFRSTQGSPSDTKETWVNTGMIALQGLTSRLTLDF